MYIIRKDLPNGHRSFKTHDGWVQVKDNEALDLSDAILFTKREAIPSNLRTHESFVWYGSYAK